MNVFSNRIIKTELKTLSSASIHCSSKKVHKKSAFSAFTFAEVLITLVIIGVVAAMTIPTLINNYNKQVTVTRLQKAYSVVSQAIKRSEAENGPTNTWTYGPGDDINALTAWFNQDLAPYLIHDSVLVPDGSGAGFYVRLNDASRLQFTQSNTSRVDIMINTINSAPQPTVAGKNRFYFSLFTADTKNAFRPMSNNDYLGSTYTGREKWTSGTYGCFASNPANRYGCAGLIMYDGWQISSDYPYFN